MPITSLDSKTALVVLDLQKGVAAYPLLHPMEGIVKQANALSKAFREKKLPVVLVVVDGVPPGRTDSPRHALNLPPDFAELIPGLDQGPGDLHVVKQASGAFANTGLKDKLRALDVTQVVLLGVATGSAVESTARQAYELGFNVSIAVDAITDAKADQHEYALSKVFPRVSETGKTQDVLDLLAQRS